MDYVLKQRVVSACVMLVVFLGVIYYLPPVLISWVVAILGAACLCELLAMLDIELFGKILLGLLFFGGFFFVDINWFLHLFIINVFLVCGLLLLASFSLAALRFKINSTIEAGYFSWCLLCFVKAVVFIWQLNMELLLAVMSLVWVTDSVAYFVGKKFGKIKCFMNISPNKSLEGCVAGLLASGAASLILLPYAGVELVWQEQLFVGLSFGMLAVIGDLFESLLKRRANVKDSGSLIPGHGGILDRIDGLLFALPIFVVIYYALIF